METITLLIIDKSAEGQGMSQDRSRAQGDVAAMRQLPTLTQEEFQRRASAEGARVEVVPASSGPGPAPVSSRGSSRDSDAESDEATGGDHSGYRRRRGGGARSRRGSRGPRAIRGAKGRRRSDALRAADREVVGTSDEDSEEDVSDAAVNTFEVTLFVLQ